MVSGGGVQAEINSDRRKRHTYGLFASRSWNSAGGRGQNINPRATIRPSTALRITLQPSYNRTHAIAQFVTQVSDPTATSTYNTRYVFATLDQHTVSASLRLNWTFTPRLGLQTYVQPFVSSAAHRGYKSLARARSYEFEPSGYTPDNPLDFTVRSLKGNAVLRWEYRPGSTLFLVWTQRRSGSDPIAESPLPVERVGDARPENIVLVKLSYYLSR